MLIARSNCDRRIAHFATVSTDLPTFHEIKAEDLPPLVKKKSGRFLCSKNIALFDLPESTEITKLVLNNNTSICLYFICYNQ